MLFQGIGGGQYEIVFAQRGRERSIDLKRDVISGLTVQPVPISAKRKHRLQRVPSVWHFAADVEREVELGGSDLGEGQGEALAVVRPVTSLELRRAFALSSAAATSAARQAKRASIRRPAV